MHEYKYKEAKAKIEEILASPTHIIDKTSIPTNEYEYTDTIAIKTWAGCLFVDIADSHRLFDNPSSDTVRVMKSFFSSLMELFEDDSNQREVGIRDDCIYCIYDLGKKEDLAEMLNTACTINTFLMMFNKILENKGLQKITAGIGLGCDYEMIMKLGNSNTKSNDKLWIGNAIGHASYLSNLANRNGQSPILMSNLFYANVMPALLKENEHYTEWIKPHYNNDEVDYYGCDLVMQEFYAWLKNDMK